MAWTPSTLELSEVELTDEELVGRFVHDDLGALEAFYDRHHGIALGVACRVLGDRLSAEDVVQEAFLNVWRRADSYQASRGSAKNWLLGIVRNRSIDVLRSRAVHPKTVPIEDMLPKAETADVWEDVSRSLDSVAIRRSLVTLPSEQRQTIELAYFGGMTCSEIANMMTVPIGTVKGRLRLALKKLRVTLGGLGMEAAAV